ncbi:MAG: hypothetical protein U9R64_12835 [Pseudomonadota bacterium]|nr:hypothetical protein [Pseudomonadota bacterium]
MRPPARTQPFSDAELRAMWANGDTVTSIWNRAYRLDRSVTRARVRAILFGGVPA